MDVSKEPSAPGLSDWQLEFARLIAFPAESPLFMEQHWWQDLAGQPEDFRSIRTNHTLEYQGSFQGIMLTLTLDANLIVWLAKPTAQFGTVTGDLPTLGPFREKVDWFVELLTPWLASQCPPIRRLSFGGKLLQAAATQQDAFRVLAAHLPGVKLDPNPNDFVLQVNRRKESSNVVTGLPLNRVSSWAKMNVTFSVQPGIPFKWPESCYSALEVDINTAPEKTDLLPRQFLPDLLKELARLGVEIAEHGDIS
jgi:hypothetical protein